MEVDCGLVFVLDDSPVNLQQDAAKALRGESVDMDMHQMDARPISIEEVQASLSMQDGHSTLVCMKKAGQGSKPYKRWLKLLELQEEGDSESFAKFWRKEYENYSDFQMFHPKLMVAGDVLNSLQMRLSYWLHNSGAPELLTKHNVRFHPFQKGLYALSYQTLVWHLHRKDEGHYHGGWVSEAERKWVQFCMSYARLSYVDDLLGCGFVLDNGFEREDAAGRIRHKMTQYLTSLKQGRNELAHIFSSATKQKVAGGGSVKVWDLLDYPTEAMTPVFQASLFKMIANLSKIDKLPESLRGLRTCFKMQLHFLKGALRNFMVENGPFDSSG